MMVKRVSREEKREKAVVDLINQMFVIAGYQVTYQDILGQADWFSNYTMTVEQAEEFKKWGKQYLIKELKLQPALAERQMAWFNVQWGLTYSNWENYKF